MSQSSFVFYSPLNIFISFVFNDLTATATPVKEYREESNAPSTGEVYAESDRRSLPGPRE